MHNLVDAAIYFQINRHSATNYLSPTPSTSCKAFIRTIFLPADAYHRCRGGEVATVNVADIEFQLGTRMLYGRIYHPRVIRRGLGAGGVCRSGLRLKLRARTVGEKKEMADSASALKLPCRHALKKEMTDLVCQLFRHKMPTDDFVRFRSGRTLLLIHGIDKMGKRLQRLLLFL